MMAMATGTSLVEVGRVRPGFAPRLCIFGLCGLVAGVVGVVVEDGEGPVGLFGEDDSG